MSKKRILVIVALAIVALALWRFPVLVGLCGIGLLQLLPLVILVSIVVYFLLRRRSN